MSPFPIPIPNPLSLTLTRTQRVSSGRRRPTPPCPGARRGCPLAAPAAAAWLVQGGVRWGHLGHGARAPPQPPPLSLSGLSFRAQGWPLPPVTRLLPPDATLGARGGIQGPRRRAARSKRVRGGWPHARLRARALSDHAAVRATNLTLTATLTPTLTLTLTRPFWTTLRCAPCAERPPCSSAYLTHDDPTRVTVS